MEAEASAGGAGGIAGAVDVESITCLTPGVCEAMLRAVARAASLGTWPERVTIPSFAETAIEAVLSNGSANIFAWMSVVIVASFVLLHAKHRSSGNEKKTSNCL